MQLWKLVPILLAIHPHLGKSMNAVYPTPGTQPSSLLTRFARFVELDQPSTSQLTIKDLRLAVRKDRLTEISSWSFKELDEIEDECSNFDESMVVG